LFDDLHYLAVPLPEDIIKAKAFGDFDLARKLILARIRNDLTPLALKKRLELELHIQSMIPDEYPLTEAEALEELRADVGDFSDQDWQTLVENDRVDWIYKRGVRYIKDDALSNLYKTDAALAKRAFLRGKRDQDGSPSVILDDTIAEMKAKGVLHCHFHVRSEMTVDHASDGIAQPLRVWLPIPCQYAQVSSVNILKVSHPQTARISAPAHPQRAVMMDGTTEDGSFFVEYEYDLEARYMAPESDRVSCQQPSIFTDERPPHIRFTPALKALAAQIVGQETNSLVKARMIYEYITHHIRYSYMRPYITIPMIPEYAAVNQKGDCGVQALLFITLCRICGIPARWQSGVYLEPGDVGIHDWAQFYVAPYGWLFCDCSFGGSAVRRGLREREVFYFCNIDPFRMPANAEFQHDFELPPRYMRYDPYDNQLGEAETPDGPLLRSRRRIRHTLISVSGIDAVRERPEYQP